ncbi:uncharacterized protein EAE98_010016 [Botrytis deweyae]|uniref:Uncharacterized protein n=1 Tax=Botrytis deweyae TaxID=2478750 RepID=A0ABQ7IA45_9HELO|nr:uncharacterized protein EAE98_010016 [Botrytis deweyae]KAF7917988.1 hypothetical protein EAE98_010016 [Botrytis deweyae]
MSGSKDLWTAPEKVAGYQFSGDMGRSCQQMQRTMHMRYGSDKEYWDFRTSQKIRCFNLMIPCPKVAATRQAETNPATWFGGSKISHVH